MVLMREACPGQSTRVNLTTSTPRAAEAGTMKEEKPRSKVIPLARLWGFLSKAAVEATVLRTFAAITALEQVYFSRTIHTLWDSPKEVLPLSTCPNIPTFKFNVDFSITKTTQFRSLRGQGCNGSQQIYPCSGHVTHWDFC